jgi:hypothetical protein
MMKGKRYGADEVAALIQREEADRKCKITMAAVDWFWPMVTRSYDSLEMGRGKRLEPRTYAQEQIDRLKLVAQSTNTWVWVTHQLNPEKALLKRDMEFEDAAELKSFAWYMNGCFCLTKMDSERIATLKYSKARGSPVAKKLLQLKGELATFVSLEGYREYDERFGKYVDPATKNVLPSEAQVSERRAYEGRAGSF